MVSAIRAAILCLLCAPVRAGRAKALLVSGGYTAGHIAEAEMMRAVAVAAGLAPQDVWTEDSAVNTIENAAFSTRVARRRGARTAVLVSLRAHLSWARRAFETAGGGWWGSLALAEADGTGSCFPQARPLALSAAAAGVAWDDLFISSGRRVGQISGAIEPSEDPWLRIPNPRVALLAPPERQSWWKAHFSTGLRV